MSLAGAPIVFERFLLAQLARSGIAFAGAIVPRQPRQDCFPFSAERKQRPPALFFRGRRFLRFLIGQYSAEQLYISAARTPRSVEFPVFARSRAPAEIQETLALSSAAISSPRQYIFPFPKAAPGLLCFLFPHLKLLRQFMTRKVHVQTVQTMETMRAPWGSYCLHVCPIQYSEISRSGCGPQAKARRSGCPGNLMRSLR